MHRSVSFNWYAIFSSSPFITFSFVCLICCRMRLWWICSGVTCWGWSLSHDGDGLCPGWWRVCFSVGSSAIFLSLVIMAMVIYLFWDVWYDFEMGIFAYFCPCTWNSVYPQSMTYLNRLPFLSFDAHQFH